MSPVATQAYQAFKLWLGEYVPIDRDLLHIGIGAGLLALAFLIAKHRRRAVLTAAILALVAAIFMEALDLRDAWASDAALRWDLSALDILCTIFLPVAALLWQSVTEWKGKRQVE